MGCSSSSARLRSFQSFVEEGNAMACVMQTHWDSFLRENDLREAGNRQAAKHLSEHRTRLVKVNTTVGQARAQSLNYTTVRNVVHSFVTFARGTIEERGWKGAVHSNLEGVAGRECNVIIEAGVSYSDTWTNYTIPYRVEYTLFLCDD